VRSLTPAAGAGAGQAPQMPPQTPGVPMNTTPTTQQ